MVQEEKKLYKAQTELYELMPARTARKKASGNISDTCQLELQAAMQCIYKAVENGNVKCWCYTYLHEQCINELRKLGYEVHNHSTQRDGILFEIKW